MIDVIVGTKRRIDDRLRSANAIEASFATKNSIISATCYVAIAVAKAPLIIARTLVSIPIHTRLSTQQAFEQTARRASSGEFIDSYTQHIREQRHAILTMVAMLVAAGIELSVLGFGLFEVGRPTTANAYTTSVDITASWDGQFEHDVTYDNCVQTLSDVCHADTENPMSLGRSQNPPSPCTNIFDGLVPHNRVAVKFPLSSIPDGATVTDVKLVMNVVNATNQTVNIKGLASDTPESLSCDTSSGFDSIATGTSYTNATWSTTGQKIVTMPGIVVTAVQTRITGSDVLPIGLYTDENSNNDALISSIEDGTPASRPTLRVTYTLPPQAPTATSHGAISTSTIAWAWADNATVETRYDIHDASHSPVAGCTNLGANIQTCTETGLSANTQYTRHPNVTDANGNTDGATASAYTAQNTPSAVANSTATSTSVSVAVTGSLPNLTAGSSGIYVQENVTASNSGWQTGTTWTKTGLLPNTQYSFQAKARNGDAVETGLTSVLTSYTLAAAPNVTNARSTATWYATPTFTFINAAGFGSGGVEYYGYAWNQQPSYTFSGAEPQWSSSTLALDSAQDGAWYLHVDAYDQTDNNSGGSATYGPYYYDASAPTPPSVVNDGIAADIDSTTETGSLSANWSAAVDNGSGLAGYEYAIGTTAGGTQVASYTGAGLSTSVTRSGLALTDGSTYYISVRAIDSLGHAGAVTSSDGVTVQLPAAPTPPAAATVISNVQVVVGETTATVTWTTNEAATTKVRYGLTAAYGTIVSSPTLTKVHSAKLSNLKSNTTYHFQVASVGSTTATTADDTFKTVSITSTVNRAIGPTLFAPTVVDGDNNGIQFTGVAKGNQTLRVYIDGRVVRTIKTSGTSTQTKIITFTITADSLQAGSHSLYVQSTDQNGRTSIIRQIIKFTIGSPTSSTPTLRLNTASTYVVQPGDSLWSISQRFLGDGSRYPEIVALNADTLPSISGSAHIIQPGWVIQLPAGRL